MTNAEKRTAIAFGISIVVIGYRFLPVQAPEGVNWFASIVLLIIGAYIIIQAIATKRKSS